MAREENGFGTIKSFYFPHMREHDPQGLAVDESQLAKGELGIGSLKSRKKVMRNIAAMSGRLAALTTVSNRAKYIEPPLRKIESVSTQLKLASSEHKTLKPTPDFSIATSTKLGQEQKQY